MPYSKIINIESKLSNINYNFSFDNRVSFRFLTKNNLLGIELVGFDKIPSKIGNWYNYDNTMTFNELIHYRNLIIQIESDVILNNDYFSVENINYYYICKNDWYNCQNYGPNCGIEIIDINVDENKPIQEVNTLFNYIINGDAKFLKGKYLKAGSVESTVIVKGKKPFLVSYNFRFKLCPINQPSSDKKPPISIKGIVDLIDTNVFPYSRSDDKEINSINSRLELIKFQIKNYFIENNKEIDSINESINLEKETNKKQSNEIKNLDEDIENNKILFEGRVKTIKGEIDELSVLLNNELTTINENFDEVDSNFSEINTFTTSTVSNINSIRDDLSTLSANLDTISSDKDNNSSNITNIESQIDAINSRIDELSNENLKSLNSNSHLISKLFDLGNSSECMKIDHDRLENDVRLLANDLKNFKDNSKNLLWGNINGYPYQIGRHQETLTLNFPKWQKKYSSQKLFLLVDYNNIILPYYAILVKDFTSDMSIVRLIQMTKYAD